MDETAIAKVGGGVRQPDVRVHMSGRNDIHTHTDKVCIYVYTTQDETAG